MQHVSLSQPLQPSNPLTHTESKPPLPAAAAIHPAHTHIPHTRTTHAYHTHLPHTRTTHAYHTHTTRTHTPHTHTTQTKRCLMRSRAGLWRACLCSVRAATWTAPHCWTFTRAWTRSCWRASAAWTIKLRCAGGRGRLMCGPGGACDGLELPLCV